jgi:hypothetical protein
VVLPKYGVGTFTGTPVNNLAVDANGNVAEILYQALQLCKSYNNIDLYNLALRYALRYFQ